MKEYSTFALSRDESLPHYRLRVKGPAWHVCGARLFGAGDGGYKCDDCVAVGWLVPVPFDQVTAN